MIAPLPIGTLLGGSAQGARGTYRVERVLGIGGFGVTYLCRLETGSRMLVVKEFAVSALHARGSDRVQLDATSTSNAAMSERLRARFLREFKILSSIWTRFRASNVVRGYEAWDENGSSYFSMAFVHPSSPWPSTPLGHDDSPVRWKEIEGLALALLDALELVHTAGIVCHGDVKPENVLVRGSGDIVLIDFGSLRLSQELDEETRTLLHTPGWSAPELTSREGLRGAGAWTDLYSWALMVWGLISPHPTTVFDDRVDKKVPWPASPVERHQASSGEDPYADEAPLIAKGVPPRWRKALLECLRLRPAERPASIAHVRAMIAPPPVLQETGTAIRTPNVEGGVSRSVDTETGTLQGSTSSEESPTSATSRSRSWQARGRNALEKLRPSARVRTQLLILTGLACVLVAAWFVVDTLRRPYWANKALTLLPSESTRFVAFPSLSSVHATVGQQLPASLLSAEQPEDARSLIVHRLSEIVLSDAATEFEALSESRGIDPGSPFAVGWVEGPTWSATLIALPTEGEINALDALLESWEPQDEAQDRVESSSDYTMYTSSSGVVLLNEPGRLLIGLVTPPHAASCDDRAEATDQAAQWMTSTRQEPRLSDLRWARSTIRAPDNRPHAVFGAVAASCTPGDECAAEVRAVAVGLRFGVDSVDLDGSLALSPSVLAELSNERTWGDAFTTRRPSSHLVRLGVWSSTPAAGEQLAEGIHRLVARNRSTWPVPDAPQAPVAATLALGYGPAVASAPGWQLRESPTPGCSPTTFTRLAEVSPTLVLPTNAALTSLEHTLASFQNRPGTIYEPGDGTPTVAVYSTVSAEQIGEQPRVSFEPMSVIGATHDSMVFATSRDAEREVSDLVQTYEDPALEALAGTRTSSAPILLWADVERLVVDSRAEHLLGSTGLTDVFGELLLEGSAEEEEVRLRGRLRWNPEALTDIARAP